MSDNLTKNIYLRNLGKALGITALAFVLSFIFMTPFSASVAAFFSTPEKNDFTITDFYNIVADSRAVSHLDDNVIIINIDHSDRQEIADILQITSLVGPKTVGLDVMFDDPREGDEYLHEAIRMNHSIVIPINMRPDDDQKSFHISDYSYFYPVSGTDSLNLNAYYAAASMPSKYDRGMVREMQVYFPTESRDTILSLPVALAKQAAPESYNTLMARNNKLESINFHSRRYVILSPEELIANPDTLTGKIVLLGSINDPGDLHSTPVNSSMPGVLIHANALSTILDNAYMESIPKWCNILIGFLLCFMIVYTHITVSTGAKGLILRLIQVALIWIIVQLGYRLFLYSSLVIDFSYAMLMLAFGLFALDIWSGFQAIFNNLRAKYREYKLKSKKTNKI